MWKGRGRGELFDFPLTLAVSSYFFFEGAVMELLRVRCGG